MAASKSDSTLVWVLAIPVVAAIHMPLVRYVMAANSTDVTRRAFASRILPRHVVALIATSVWLTCLLAEESSLWPGGYAEKPAGGLEIEEYLFSDLRDLSVDEGGF